MSDIFVHIGLHKTATTALQKYYFPLCRNINNLTVNKEVQRFVQEANTVDPVYFNNKEWRVKIQSILSENQPNIISSESLSGALYAGVGKAGMDHRTPILQNLKAALPEAKIILVIRKQDDLARSIYRQYLKVGGIETPGTFFGCTGRRSAIFPLNRFRYGPYIDQLYSLFKNGVLILVYEELVHDKEAFLGKLASFLGISMVQMEMPRSNQTRLGSGGMIVSRVINRVFRSQLNPGGFLLGLPRIREGRIKWESPSPIIHDKWPIKGKVSTKSQIYKISQDILNKVKKDNELLDKKYKLGLASMRYY